MAARSCGSSLLSNDVLSPTFPSLVIWKLVYDNREGDRGCDQCCRYISFQIFANKEIGGNFTKTINANKDSAREAPAIPLKIMIQREHLVRVLIHVI